MVGLRAVTLDADGDGISNSTLREIKLLSQLQHQHIVRLLEIVKGKNSDLASNYMKSSGRQQPPTLLSNNNINVTSSPCHYDHITPLLCCLHWLRAPQRISFKLGVMVYQSVHALGPAYLADALQPVARNPGQQRLRLSSTSALDVPPTTQPSTALSVT